MMYGFTNMICANGAKFSADKLSLVQGGIILFVNYVASVPLSDRMFRFRKTRAEELICFIF